jgi:hypothetical protein
MVTCATDVENGDYYLNIALERGLDFDQSLNDYLYSDSQYTRLRNYMSLNGSDNQLIEYDNTPALIYLYGRPDGWFETTHKGRNLNFSKYKVTEFCSHEWRFCKKLCEEQSSTNIISKITSFFKSSPKTKGGKDGSVILRDHIDEQIAKIQGKLQKSFHELPSEHAVKIIAFEKLSEDNKHITFAADAYTPTNYSYHFTINKSSKTDSLIKKYMDIQPKMIADSWNPHPENVIKVGIIGKAIQCSDIQKEFCEFDLRTHAPTLPFQALKICDTSFVNCESP